MASSSPTRPSTGSCAGATATNISEIAISAASAEDDDFSVRTQEDMTGMRKQTTQTMPGLPASIAGVSLLVGGIGIMNIMLVS